MRRTVQFAEIRVLLYPSAHRPGAALAPPQHISKEMAPPRGIPQRGCYRPTTFDLSWHRAAPVMSPPFDGAVTGRF